jgi:DNA polymerase elongation subunit (family B)
MKIIAFDIETIADKTTISSLPEPEANKTLKDPVKIAADIAEKKKKQVAEMGLNPMTSLICCIGWASSEGEPESHLLKDETSASEKELLEQWWEIAKDFDHFVTFNGRSFDLRHILLHGMAHGVRPSVNIDKGRYNRGNHTDLRQVLAGEDKFASGQLDSFARKFLGAGKTEGIDGAKVQEYWDMQLYEDIGKYCENDCRITFDLYLKAEAAGLLE